MERLPGDVVEAIKAGNKIDAIKRLRAASGMGLAAAKSVVDQYGSHPVSDEPSAAVIAALEAGRKLEAIKRYRSESGVGLRDARRKIEALQDQRAGSPSDDPNARSGGQRSLLSLLVGIAIVIAVYVWLTSA